MERKHETYTRPQETERIHPKPCELPYLNGSKPVEQQRTPEARKKHIKRDEKK